MATRPSGMKLERIAPESLTVGEVLGKSIRDATGRILVIAGQILDEEAMLRLHEAGYDRLYVRVENCKATAGNSECEEPADPEEVVRALRARGQPRGVLRVRRHSRSDWEVPLTLWVEERSPEGCRERAIHVKTRDISAGGMGFEYAHYIHPGTMVRVRFEMLPGKPYLTGVVRNCNHVGSRQHRIGVQFTKVVRTDEL